MKRFACAALVPLVLVASPTRPLADIEFRRVPAEEFEAAYPPPEAVSNWRDEILNATVRVEIETGGSGSATIIGRRHVLTNFHVAGASGNHTIKGWIIAKGKRVAVTYTAKVVASDETRDLSLLELDHVWTGEVAPLARRDAALAVGDRVCAAGSPLGLEPLVTCGEVLLTSVEMAGEKHLLCSAQIAPGNSGGGLWHYSPKTGRREMVGVSRAIFQTGGSLLPYLALFIPMASVRAFLEQSKVVV